MQRDSLDVGEHERRRIGCGEDPGALVVRRVAGRARLQIDAVERGEPPERNEQRADVVGDGVEHLLVAGGDGAALLRVGVDEPEEQP